MFQFIYHIIFILINPNYFTNIEQKNAMKTAFNESFKKGQFEEALQIFKKIENITNLIEPELRLNAGQSFFLQKDTKNAKINYQYVVNSPDIHQASQALNQLGVIATITGDTLQALEYFKKAIQTNPALLEARYNYELIKKIYRPRNPPPTSQNPNQQNQVIASDIKEDDLPPNHPKSISKEKALQLLEALRNSERKVLIDSKKSPSISEKDW
jgi:tetratricopeptide (TPR) repeat protein